MYFLFLEGFWAKAAALFFFSLASLTDFLDGWLARKHQLITAFGKLLDPIADKVLIFGAFLSFVQMNILPAWMVILMLFREILVTGFRFMGASKGVVLPAGKSGKGKTVLQIVSVIVILIYVVLAETRFWNADWTANVLTAIRVGVFFVVLWTVGSGIYYTIKHWSKVTNGGQAS